MEWVWSERKAAANLAKHGIDFAVASRVFDDPWHVSRPDPHDEDDRWRTIGMVNVSILFVVHTMLEADGTARIISARKALKGERRLYEQSRR